MSRRTPSAVIRARLLDTPTAGSRQLVEQPLCFFEISGVEAFGTMQNNLSMYPSRLCRLHDGFGDVFANLSPHLGADYR